MSVTLVPMEWIRAKTVTSRRPNGHAVEAMSNASSIGMEIATADRVLTLPTIRAMDAHPCFILTDKAAAAVTVDRQ
jgi:hypothetical protein